MENKLLFIFLDGFGLGKNVDSNPFVKATMPTITNLIGGKLLNTSYVVEGNILMKGVDACLGVEGVPQSATGQTSLFTGCNAQNILGHHLMAYPNDELIALINQKSIFKFGKENNISCSFANSYSDGFFRSFNHDSQSYSVTTRCVMAAEQKFNTLNDLIDNKAVHWDITNSALQEIPNNRVPPIAAFKAGQNLCALTNDYDLVLYECFLPDLIGHKMDMEKAILFLEMLDEFIKGVLVDKASNVNVLISSDHGNIEDLSSGGHTRNLVPLIAIGNLADSFSSIHSIDEIFNAIFLNLFNIPQ